MSSDRISSCSSWASVEENPNFLITRLSRVELLTVTNVLWAVQYGNQRVGGHQSLRSHDVNVMGKDFHLARIRKGTVISGPTWEAVFKDVYIGEDINILLKGSEDDFRNDLLIIRLALC